LNNLLVLSFHNIRKNEYIELIEQAGFKDVKVIKESHFFPEQIMNGETTKILQEKSKISTETIKEVFDSVISANVHAVKP
jgi:ABC-type antimicrobial peptide transport system ATPase subunit